MVRPAKKLPDGRRLLRRAFTLVELLLVLVIIAVVTAVAVPSFVKSIRGNRLRAAAQTVVMSGKYAWSMAVLNQKDIEVAFDRESGTIHVSLCAPPVDPEAEFGEKEDEEDRSPFTEFPQAAEDEVPETTGAGFEEITRQLERVHIDYVVLEDGGESSPADKVRTVVYHSNGRCTPYTVRVVDEDGEAIVVEVDALGSARTERE